MKKEKSLTNTAGSLNNPFRNLGYSVDKDGTVHPQKIKDEVKEKPAPAKKVKHSQYDDLLSKMDGDSDATKKG